MLSNERGESPTKAMLSAGVGKDFFYNIRNNKKPSAEKIGKLAAYFNVSTDFLLGLTDDPAPSNAQQATPQNERRPIDARFLQLAERITSLSPKNFERVMDYLEVLENQDKPPK